jgi:hypothetical protein
MAVGTDVGVATGRIVLDTTDVEQGEQRVRRSASNIQRSFVGVKAAAIDLNSAFGELGSAIGISLGIAGIVQLGRAINELTEDAAKVERVRISFDRLAAGVGQSSAAMLADMRVASRGMVSDADLVLNANRALVTGVADTAEEMGKLLEVARVRGQALGISTQEAFTRLVQGIGKREKEILDELGIVINLNDVYDEFAQKLDTTADALSEAQKTQAFFNAVIEDSTALLKDAGEEADNAADKLEKHQVAVDNLRQALGELFVEGQTNSASFWTVMIDGLTDYIKAFQQLQNIGFGVPLPSLTPSAANRMTPAAGVSGPRFTPEQEDLIVQRDADLKEIEAESRSERLEAVTEFNESVADVEHDYQQRMGREAQDFARSRLRQEQDLTDSILDIRRESAQREQKASADLARTLERARVDSEKRIANSREDVNERLAELDEDFQRDQQRRQEKFRDDMLSAAGRLDAVALLELRKDRARELKDAKDAHKEQRDDLQEQLQERIQEESENLAERRQQAQEAHDRQNADAKEADEQRIRDMNADFEERKRREDEDRAIRLGRMAEDHRERLDEMGRQHRQDLEQIATQQQEKRAKIEEEFNKESKLNDAWIKENARVAASAIADFTAVADAGARAARLIAMGLHGVSSLPGDHSSGADPYADRDNSFANSNFNVPYNPVPGWRANSGMSSNTTRNQTINANITINGDGLNEREVAEKVIEMLEGMN